MMDLVVIDPNTDIVIFIIPCLTKPQCLNISKKIVERYHSISLYVNHLDETRIPFIIDECAYEAEKRSGNYRH